MIFVTVGTHEQQFNRLIKEVDELKKNNIINDEVFIQTGYSDYVPKYCNYKKFLTYDEMEEYMDKANIVITHGGPASFMKSLSLGKKTIIVPRLRQFNEHVNNHQLEFLEVIKNYYGILYVKNISSLESILFNISNQNIIYKSNNFNFCKEFKKNCILRKVIFNYDI